MPRRDPQRRLRARLVVAVLAAAALVGAGAALASGLRRTHHTGHLPVFTARGALSPRFHVGSRGRGDCWTSSIATGAGDAYRCLQGNLIHDPCFAPTPHARLVACFVDPWHPVTLLRLTRALPRHAPATADLLPWAIETTDGRRCTFLTGATAPMDGLRIDYGCTDHTFLVGAPDRRAPLWTIRSARRYVPGYRKPLPAVGISVTVP